MSMTKREFESEINSHQTEDLSMWEGYEEYLYQQHAYSDYIEPMYEFFNTEETNKPTTLPNTATEFVDSRNEPKGNMSALDMIWAVVERLGKGGGQ